MDASERRQKRPKWSSFSHQIQFQPTQIDRVQLEAVNRPVPCKQKGIREFWRFSANPELRLEPYRGSQGQILSAHAQPFAKLFTDRSGRQNEEVAPEDSEELLLAQGVLAALLACHESSVRDVARPVGRFRARRTLRAGSHLDLALRGSITDHKSRGRGRAAVRARLGPTGSPFWGVCLVSDQSLCRVRFK